MHALTAMSTKDVSGTQDSHLHLTAVDVQLDHVPGLLPDWRRRQQ